MNEVKGITPRQADKIIKDGQPVKLRSIYGETFEAIFTSRDRWHMYTADGGKYDRTDMEVIQD